MPIKPLLRADHHCTILLHRGRELARLCLCHGPSLLCYDACATSSTACLHASYLDDVLPGRLHWADIRRTWIERAVRTVYPPLALARLYTTTSVTDAGNVAALPSFCLPYRYVVTLPISLARRRGHACRLRSGRRHGDSYWNKQLTAVSMGRTWLGDAVAIGGCFHLATYAAQTQALPPASSLTHWYLPPHHATGAARALWANPLHTHQPYRATGVHKWRPRVFRTET